VPCKGVKRVDREAPKGNPAQGCSACREVSAGAAKEASHEGLTRAARRVRIGLTNPMADYLVGARYICLSCRERGLHASCARCGERALDLADAADRSTLSARWSGARPFEAGLGLWSLRNLRLASRLRRATVIATVVIIVGAGTAATLDGRSKSPGEVAAILAGVAIMGALFAPPLGLFFLVYANVVRILGLIVEIIWPLAEAAASLIHSTVRARFGLVRTLLWWIESALLPRISLSSLPPFAGAEQSGTLIEPLRLSLLIDESGWMWCADGVLYFNEGCQTYSREAQGQCSSLVAVDPSARQVLWRTRPLISNATFLVADRYLITGYGFTAEPDALCIVRRSDGKVMSRTPISSAHSTLELSRDGVLTVSAYGNPLVRFLAKGFDGEKPQLVALPKGGPAPKDSSRLGF